MRHGECSNVCKPNVDREKPSCRECLPQDSAALGLAETLCIIMTSLMWLIILGGNMSERGVKGGEERFPPSLSARSTTPSLPPFRRFDQYESFDSRGPSSLPSRDLYRSGSYGYGDGRGDMTQRASGFGGGGGLGSGFDSSSSYGAAKMQRQNMRDSFSSGQGGGSWAGAGQRSPRRGGGRGGFGGRRSDPTHMGGGGGRMGGRGGGRGGGGHSPGGRGKLPSLLGHRMPPQTGAFHQSAQQGRVPGHQDFPGRHFGGGPQGGHQRGRKRPLNRVSTLPYCPPVCQPHSRA